MKRRSRREGEWNALREKLIGLGEASIRKSYYPELQQRLRELSRFKALLDEARDLIFLMEIPSGRLIDCNRSAVRKTGHRREGLLGRPLTDLTGPEAFDRIHRFFADAVSGGVIRETLETTLTGADGTVLPVEITLGAVRFDEIPYAAAVARDITARIRAEAALRRSERRYRNLFEESLAGHFISAPDGRLIDCNPAFARIFGFDSVADAIRTNLSALYPGPDHRRQIWDRVRRERKVEQLEIRMRHRSGRFLHIRITAVGSFDDQGRLTGLKGYLFDDSERKRLEEAFLQAQKMEAVGRLAAGVVHDFNNVLSSIMGYGNLMLLKLPEGDPLRENARRICHNVDRASELIRQLLTFSRKQPASPKVVDLNHVVRQTAPMVTGVLGEGIAFDLLLEAESGRVVVDPLQMEQVLLNLAVNARDAMPHGGVLSIGTEEVFLDDGHRDWDPSIEPGRYVLLSVGDTGTGMDDRTRRHLFEPFFTTKAKGEGTGLGLATVYGIIRGNQGHIRVESAVRRGSSFRIYLPRAAGVNGPDPGQEPAGGHPGTPARPGFEGEITDAIPV